MLGEHPKTTSVNVKFIVVQAPSAYNVLLGRPSLNKARAVISTTHLRMKLSTPFRVGQVKADQRIAKQCYVVSLEETKEGEQKKKAKAPPPAEIAPDVLNYGIKDFRDEIKIE